MTFSNSAEEQKRIDSEDQKRIDDLHDEACRQNRLFYTDPKTGLIVFTKLKLVERGYCCKSGCRHCPYGFKKDTL